MDRYVPRLDVIFSNFSYAWERDQKRLGVLQPGGFKFHHRKGQSPSIGGGNERPKFIEKLWTVGWNGSRSNEEISQGINQSKARATNRPRNGAMI